MEQVKVRGTDRWLTIPPAPAHCGMSQVKAYRRGFSACCIGHTIDVNPYERIGHRHWWAQGWYEANRQIRTGTESPEQEET